MSFQILNSLFVWHLPLKQNGQPATAQVYRHTTEKPHNDMVEKHLKKMEK